MEHLKYPIGKPDIPENITSEHLEKWTQTLEEFPEKLEKLVTNLSDEQIDSSYREGGWTIRQVVHHCADSHHNSYTRFKWTLTEDKPVIKAYFEDRWAELFDSKSAPIQLSLLHLKVVHAKLVYFIKGLTDDELSKSFIHPESNEEVVLKENIGIYAWHCNHHYAHIENLLIRKG
ncbi:YfiT family bacillithiol transferase [Tenacibaculum sp. IB213877]|uniref:YfiT family bacillithiol transferase n=1 Tax=Tenacibaculum sp. IB213877 TaxID=3097351 RepID=UPI002A5A7DC7|nr:putative metal-dependent hydrolase [Tenacibaculum sp. IB213877]MDY0779686.1 putative metal-dependent hydrolase [Tenacibaculum sp. IB213877]